MWNWVIFILSSLFYFKEIYKWSLSTLIDMAIQFYNNTLFWQFKFWSGFCWSGRALVSFWAGNCQPDLATLEVTLRAVLTSFSEAADVHVRSCPSSKQTRHTLTQRHAEVIFKLFCGLIFTIRVGVCSRVCTRMFVCVCANRGWISAVREIESATM